MEQNIARPLLIMVRGLPGSGKSHLAAELASELGKDNTVVLDPDALDTTDEAYQAFSRELEKEGVDKRIHPFRWSRKRACDAIAAQKIVIWNQPFTDRGIFERLVAFLEEYAREQGLRLPVLVVEVEIDPEVAKARIARRKQEGGHGPSEGTFAARVRDYQSYADGFRTVTVQGEDDVKVSIGTILQALNNLS
jgi:Thymidylate kinase